MTCLYTPSGKKLKYVLVRDQKKFGLGRLLIGGTVQMIMWGACEATARALISELNGATDDGLRGSDGKAPTKTSSDGVPPRGEDGAVDIQNPSALQTR